MPSICPARSSEARVVRASIRRLGMIGGPAGLAHVAPAPAPAAPHVHNDVKDKK